MFWKVAGAVGAMGLMMGAGAGSQPATRPFRLGKETTGVVGPLLKDGRVDYVGAMNERYGAGVQAEENGFVGWIEVVGRGAFSDAVWAGIRPLCGAGADAGTKGLAFENYFEYLRRNAIVMEPGADWEAIIRGAGQKVWKREENGVLAGYLKEEGEALDRAVGVSEKEKWWMPTWSKTGLLVGNLQNVPAAWGVAYALAARATLRAGAGDGAGCIGDVVAMKKLARLFCMGGSTWEHLEGMQMDEAADGAIVAAAVSLTKEQCAALGKALAAVGERRSVTDVIDHAERWSELDIAEFMLVEKPNIFQPSSEIDRPFHLVDWKDVDGDEVLKLVNATVDAMVKASAAPTEEEAASAGAAFNARMEAWGKAWAEKNNKLLFKEEGETRAAYSERVGRAAIAGFMPDLAKVVKLEWRAKGKDAAAEAALERREGGK